MMSPVQKSFDGLCPFLFQITDKANINLLYGVQRRSPVLINFCITMLRGTSSNLHKTLTMTGMYRDFELSSRNMLVQEIG